MFPPGVFQEIRQGRRDALAFLRIGEQFSPSACAGYLRALVQRLEQANAAIHDPSDRADARELVEDIWVQIRALENQQ